MMMNYKTQRCRQNNCLMTRVMHLSALLCILMPCYSLVAQSIDIDQLVELQEFRKSQDESIDTTSIIEDKSEQARSEQRRNKEFLEDEDENYGYTGRRDFIISPQSKTLNKPLKYFGYDYFIDAATTFAPVTDISIPPDYILGPGDEIKIILFGNENNQYVLQVSRDGDIFFPKIGPVSVAGLTFQDLKVTIQQIVDNQLIGTQVGLTLGALRSINIFVLGEASQPGMYTVSSLSTLTNAIFASGGIKTTGSLRNIELKRSGKVLSSFDFYNLLLNGDTSADKRLMSGDVVFIPPITKTVGIAGEIERPGIYELHHGETAEQLIRYAGKLKPKADLTSLEIQRIDSVGNGFKLINIDLSQSSFSKLHLSDGDVLTVYPVLDRMRNAILFSGHTQKPGFYPWKEGMKILDLIVTEENLLPMTDVNYVLIKRENNLNQSYQTLQVDLEELFRKPDTDQNIVLKERDEIIFFPTLLTPDLIKVTSKAFMPADTDTDTISEPAQLYEENNYFQYTIHDYCTLDADYAESILNLEGAEGANQAISAYCRNQLLEPVIAALEQQGTAKGNKLTIDVFGNVAFPGKYPLSEKATLGDAIKASGGLKGFSYIDEIEIIRRNLSGKEMTMSTINLEFSENAESLLVQSLDAITIKKVPIGLRVASVRGEVFFPGTYPITSGETLRELIERAGGLKDKASKKSAVFQREYLKEMELARLRQFQTETRRNLILSEQKQGTGQESTLDLSLLNMLFSENFEQDTTLTMGRLVIDLEALLQGQASDNLILEDGDVLTIPKVRQSVSVIGEIYVPSTHMFQENFTVQDYIEMSGGYKEYADNDNGYVIKSNGSIVTMGSNNRFFRSEKGALEKGDTIVIPLKMDQFSALKATSDITQIIYQMALATAAVNSF